MDSWILETGSCSEYHVAVVERRFALGTVYVTSRHATRALSGFNDCEAIHTARFCWYSEGWLCWLHASLVTRASGCSYFLPQTQDWLLWHAFPISHFERQMKERDDRVIGELGH